MVRQRLEFCADCGYPAVEDVDREPAARDETIYRCRHCGEVKEGAPELALADIQRRSEE